MNTQLEALRQYFQSGATQPFEFRLLQLKRLKQMVLDNEQALYKALYADLKKIPVRKKLKIDYKL